LPEEGFQGEAIKIVKENPELLMMLKNGGQVIDCGCGSYSDGGYVDTFIDERIVSKVEDKNNPFAKFGLKKNFRTDAFDRLDIIESKSVNFCDSFPQVCSENVGLARENMPQIYEEYIPEYLDFLQQNGISAKIEYDIPVKTLTASQEEISVPRISRMLKRLLNGYYIDAYGNKVNPLKKKLIITKDNFVLDGHHRWATMYFLSPENTIDALRVNADIKDIIPLSKEFGMVQFQEFMFGGKVSAKEGEKAGSVREKTLKVTRSFFPKSGLTISPLIIKNKNNNEETYSEYGFSINNVSGRSLLKGNAKTYLKTLRILLDDEFLRQNYIVDISVSLSAYGGNSESFNKNQADDIIKKSDFIDSNIPFIAILINQLKQGASVDFSFVFNKKALKKYGDNLEFLELILNELSRLFKNYDFINPLEIQTSGTRMKKQATATATPPTTITSQLQPSPYDIRFKTEQEFIDDYGDNWKTTVDWKKGMDYLFGKKIEKNDSNLFNFFEKNPNIGGYFNVSNNFGIENPLFPNDVNFNTWSLFRKMFVYTKKQSQSPQSNANKPTDYLRFKTEQEFIDEYGSDWVKEVGWENGMEYLFGKEIDKKFDNVELWLNAIENQYNDGYDKRFYVNVGKDLNIKNPLAPKGTRLNIWGISKVMLTDKPLPKSKKPTQNLLPLDELDNKIQSIQDLVAESFSPDEVVVQEFLLEELKKLNKQKQESSLVKYYSNDLSALLDLYSRKISLPQREVMGVACGRETPSGAPSELDSMQYGWVRTIQFKAWFGDWEEAYKTKNYVGVSKAINERTGEPLVVYHGKGNMKVEATYFQLSGFPIKYFAENKSYSEWFKNNYNPINVLYEFFISVKNPIDLSMVGLDEITPTDFVNLIDALYDYKIQTPMMFADRPVKVWQILRGNPKMLNEIKQNTNYDGFIIYENNPQDMVGGQENTTKDYIGYENNQFKSADGRNETFFIEVEDFRFEQGGLVNEHTL